MNTTNVNVKKKEYKYQNQILHLLFRTLHSFKAIDMVYKSALKHSTEYLQSHKDNKPTNR